VRYRRERHHRKRKGRSLHGEAELLGMTGEPFEMLVEVGRVRQFARAVKSSNPAYFEGWEPLSSPTFLASSSFWSDPKNSPMLRAGLSLERVLNGAQEFTFHGPPPRAGTRLYVQWRVDKAYVKQGKRGGTMSFMEVVFEFRSASGELLAEQRSTVIETANAVGE